MMILQLGSDGTEVLVHRFKLQNLVMAKRLWRLAVEHHAFFRSLPTLLNIIIRTSTDILWEFSGF